MRSELTPDTVAETNEAQRWHHHEWTLLRIYALRRTQATGGMLVQAHAPRQQQVVQWQRVAAGRPIELRSGESA